MGESWVNWRSPELFCGALYHSDLDTCTCNTMEAYRKRSNHSLQQPYNYTHAHQCSSKHVQTNAVCRSATEPMAQVQTLKLLKELSTTQPCHLHTTPHTIHSQLNFWSSCFAVVLPVRGSNCTAWRMRGSGAGAALWPRNGLVDGLWTFFALRYIRTRRTSVYSLIKYLDPIVTSLPYTLNHVKVSRMMLQWIHSQTANVSEAVCTSEQMQNALVPFGQQSLLPLVVIPQGLLSAYAQAQEMTEAAGRRTHWMQCIPQGLHPSRKTAVTRERDAQKWKNTSTNVYNNRTPAGMLTLDTFSNLLLAALSSLTTASWSRYTTPHELEG